MTLSGRDRRALLILAGALLFAICEFILPSATASAPAADADDTAMVRQNVVRARQLAALVPARAAVMKQAASDLADRERGIIQADTFPQAQAALSEIARRVGKTEQIDIRTGEFGAPKAFGDYGLVFATITFECHIEQFVNFLADLSQQPELLAPSEERITSGTAKDKVMQVRMVLAGVVAKKLVPEKKGTGAL